MTEDIRALAQCDAGSHVLMPRDPSQQIIDRMTASISVADIPTPDDPPDRDYDYDMRKAYRAALAAAEAGCSIPPAVEPAQATQPVAYFYERATARTNSGKPALWQNELTFGKPDTHEFIRNVIPLYAALRTPAASERAALTVSPEIVVDLDNEVGELRQEVVRLTAQVEEAVASFRAIQKATVEGRVCDDVAWFSQIETLHDYCDAAADRLSTPSTVSQPK